MNAMLFSLGQCEELSKYWPVTIRGVVGPWNETDDSVGLAVLSAG